MPRDFSTFTPGLESPIEEAVDVVPADSDLADGIARALYIDLAGTVIVTGRSGVAVTYSNLAVGVWHPIQVKRIAAASTAEGIKVGY